MLGIYESDTEDEQMNGNQSQSVIDESQNQSQAYDMEQFNHQIDSNDLSSSRIQVLNEQSINDNYVCFPIKYCDSGYHKRDVMLITFINWCNEVKYNNGKKYI